MSLMKLLSVSRSFVNGGGLQGRYKMVQQGRLPKFDAAKPFASSVTPAAVGTVTLPVGDATSVKRGVDPWWRRFFRRRNPFAKGDRRRRGGVRAAQGELALDRVRVLRNDLRDADFELVDPAATRESAGRVRGWRGFPGVGKAGAAWNRLTSRWGGGGGGD